MKVTIDSNEPLQDALRVIGAVYDVQLTVAEPSTAAPHQPPGHSRRPASPDIARPPRRSPRKATSKRASTPASPTTAELRDWARLNGHQVNDRGRVPAAVSTAYQEATRR